MKKILKLLHKTHCESPAKILCLPMTSPYYPPCFSWDEKLFNKSPPHTSLIISGRSNGSDANYTPRWINVIVHRITEILRSVLNAIIWLAISVIFSRNFILTTWQPVRNEKIAALEPKFSFKKARSFFCWITHRNGDKHELSYRLLRCTMVRGKSWELKLECIFSA